MIDVRRREAVVQLGYTINGMLEEPLQSGVAKPALHLIGVASGRGAKNRGCASGPAALQSRRLAASLRSHGIRAAWTSVVKPEQDFGEDLAAVAAVAKEVARIVEGEVRRRHFFSVLGGDHSCATGTWSGAACALRRHGRLGLIWIDAHMDSHTPETSPSGAFHGMPLACLLGYGPQSLTSLAGPDAAILPAHVVLLGVRSFEPAEESLLAKLGVRVYKMAEIRRRGLEAVMASAVRIAGTGTAGFGISIDLDGIDPRDAPAVGSPVPDGIRGHEILPALRMAAKSGGLIGAEIAEFNPALDRGGRTLVLIQDLLRALVPA